MQRYFEDLSEGSELPALVKPAVTRVQLAQYAGASGDFTPIHIDPDFAREAGLGDVIAHGMLSMGFLGQYAAGVAGPAGQVIDLQVAFRGMVRVGDVLTCQGKVTGRRLEAGRGLVTLALAAVNPAGKPVTGGEATISLLLRAGGPGPEGGR